MPKLERVTLFVLMCLLTISTAVSMYWVRDLAKVSSLDIYRPLQTQRPIMTKGLAKEEIANVASWHLDRPSLLAPYVVISVADQNRESLGKLSAAAGSLGWRSAHLQYALVHLDAVRSDTGQVLTRIDALLRRKKIERFGYQVLNTLELDPQQADLLSGVLEANPPWLADYLSKPDFFSTPAQRTARSNMALRIMRATGNRDRNVFAPVVRELFMRGAVREAYSVWLGLVAKADTLPRSGSQKLDTSLYGIGFEARLTPFDWVPETGSGHYIMVDRSHERQKFAIDWNGTGRSEIFSRHLDVERIPSIQLSILGRRLAMGSESILSSFFSCNGSTTDLPLKKATDNQVVFAARLPSGCSIGKLQVILQSKSYASNRDGLEINDIIISESSAIDRSK